MMNKKLFSALLTGGLLFSFTGGFVSCSEDYDDDIKDLQTQITANSNAIAEIQALLAKGVVITNVTKNAEGILLTMSDGSTQQLTNGKDGADGKDGKDAAVWTIGNDGYWYEDGVATEYKAVGEDGKDGADGKDGINGKDGADGKDGKDGVNGKDGADGKDGKDGKDGGYYVPNAETGNFDYVDADGNKKDSGISWKSSAMTAVKTETGVMFSGIAGYPDGLFISTVADLMSLVFQPQLVVDGVNAINAGVLTKGGNIICTPNVTAQYHLNPSTVNENGIDKNSLRYISITKEFKVTRAISNVEATYNNIKNGMLTVDVDFEGTPSEGSKIDLIALQVTNASGEVITSDYATVAADPLRSEDLFIARKNIIKTAGNNAHYWATMSDAKNVAINDAAVNATSTQDARIITVVYNSNIDLDDYVRTCLMSGTAHSEFTQMEDYHLSIAYTNMKFELTGMENGLKKTTDQAKFIKLDANGVVTPTTYEDGDNLRSSIGRTPIIKAELIHQENGGKKTVLQTAYIVLEIVDKEDTPPTPVGVTFNAYDIKTTDFFGQNLDFCNGDQVEITAEDMNTVYSKEGISKEEFANNYVFQPYPANVTIAGKKYGTSEDVEYAANAGQITTYGLTWSLDAEYIWNNAGKTPEAQAVYKHKNKNHYVVINLKPSAAIPARKVLEFPADGEKFAEMWNTEKTLGMFNVRVPNVGENTTAQCTFVNNLLTLYLDQKDPVTLINNIVNNSTYKVSTSTGISDTYIEYIIKDASCEGSKTNGTFVVKNDGKELYYRVGLTDHLIATLNGTEVTLNDDHNNNAIAEELLNTNKLVVTYAVRAEFESCLGTQTIPCKNEVTFDVRYVRPINVNPESAGSFQDGNDFGGNGTLLKAADVISLIDWRGNAVVEGNSYYGYYGVKRVTVDNSGVTCNIAAGKNQPLPSHIKAGIVDAAALADPDLATGLNGKAVDEWFYYKNNGTVLQENIEINFPVIVEYWWGEVVTETVTVTVKKTNNINK